jgi:hypothetical protein
MRRVEGGHCSASIGFTRKQEGPQMVCSRDSGVETSRVDLSGSRADPENNAWACEVAGIMVRPNHSG